MARVKINQSAFLDPRLRAVVDHVRKRLADPKRVSLAEAALIANYSRQHFSRRFHERVGVPFTVWQCVFRMQEAKGFILRNEWTYVSVVGATVGYPNASSFGRLFERYAGVPPRKLQRFVRRHPELKGTLRSTDHLTLVIELSAISAANQQLVTLLRRLADALLYRRDSWD